MNKKNRKKQTCAGEERRGGETAAGRQRKDGFREVSKGKVGDEEQV